VRKKSIRFLIFSLFLVSLVSLYGCETWKGFCRDMEKARDWDKKVFQKNFW